MQLTNEQKYILDLVKQGEPLIKILAFAGSGKTTILKEIANANKDKRLLYLAFNKAIQTEAKKKFPSNTEVRTTHSLAYKYIVSSHRYQVRNSDYKLIELKDILSEKNWNVLKIVKIMLKEFFNTDYDDIEAVYKKRRSYVVGKIESDDLEKEAIDLTIKLYTMMKSGDIEVTHDFYLKEFQLKLKRKEIKMKPYDIILLDEAQDLNRVVYNIFKYLPAKQKVVVGDNHQSIYSFRGAVNALNKFKKGKVAYLTTSFRVTQPIANYANHILSQLKLETKPLVSGNKTKDYQIKTIAYISRTNSNLILYFDRLLSKGVNQSDIKFVRHPYEIFGLLLNLQKFKMGLDLDDSFKYLLNYDAQDMKELQQNAKKADDKELLSAIKVLRILAGVNLFELYKKAMTCYNKNKNREVTHTLLTAHTSKGLEFDKVILLDGFTLSNNIMSYIENNDDDIINLDLSELFLFYNVDELIEMIYYVVKNNISPALIEEFNLFYVAVTRARYEIELNDDELELFFNSKNLKEFLETLKKENS